LSQSDIFTLSEFNNTVVELERLFSRELLTFFRVELSFFKVFFVFYGSKLDIGQEQSVIGLEVN